MTLKSGIIYNLWFGLGISLMTPNWEIPGFDSKLGWTCRLVLLASRSFDPLLIEICDSNYWRRTKTVLHFVQCIGMYICLSAKLHHYRVRQGINLYSKTLPPAKGGSHWEFQMRPLHYKIPRYKWLLPLKGEGFFYLISKCSVKPDPMAGGRDWSGAEGRGRQEEILMPTEETHQKHSIGMLGYN